MIKHSIEIDRPAEEVFAYLDQLDRHSEWQSSLVSANVETDGPTRVGTRVLERRKVPGGTRDIPYEITAHEPPRKASFRGTAGPGCCYRTASAESSRYWHRLQAHAGFA